MRKLSFPVAVDTVLCAAGFERKSRSVWERRTGPYLDNIDLQIGSNLTEITVNLHLLNDEVGSIIRAASPDGRGAGCLYPVMQRLPTLMTGFDRWWKRSDPDAPAQVAEALRTHGLPFLDGLHSSEALKRHLEDSLPFKAGDPTSRIHVAILWAREGLHDAAREALARRRKWYSDDLVRTLDNLERWIDDGAPEPLSP